MEPGRPFRVDKSTFNKSGNPAVPQGDRSDQPKSGRRGGRLVPLTLWEKATAFLRSDPLVNGLLAVAITVGFFHGWLKDTYQHAATTFLYDALLCLVLILTYTRQKKGESFIPAGPVGNALKAFYVLCFIYLLFPGGPPFMIGVAAVRGWCFATLMFCLGYRLTRSAVQVRGYFYVLILLGIITSIYGLRQTTAEVEARMEQDEVYEQRHMFTYYDTGKGRQLRIFSTFVSSGAFGGTMAYVAIFAIVLMSDPKTPKFERMLLAGALLPISYALLRTGARSALMSLMFGFVVIAWHRRNFLSWVIVPTAIFAMLKLAAVATGGSAAERFGSLLEVEEIYYRNSIPTRLGWEYMVNGHLLGGGLGQSGYSVPSFLSLRYNFRPGGTSDGDLGRLMIELGVLGLLFFGRLLAVTIRQTVAALKQLRDTQLSTVALASAACIVMALASFPSGSPFLGIPMGTLVWFFLGTLMKLHDEEVAGKFAEAPLAPPKSTAPVPEKRFLHRSGRRRRITS